MRVPGCGCVSSMIRHGLRGPIYVIDDTFVALQLACDFFFSYSPRLGDAQGACIKQRRIEPIVEVGIVVKVVVQFEDPVVGRLLRILGHVVRHDWLSDEAKRRAACEATCFP